MKIWRVPPMSNNNREEATPRGRIVGQFNELLHTSEFYNREIFPDSMLDSFTLNILSKRKLLFHVAYGNRMLLNFVFPNDVLERFDGIPTQTHLDEYRDYNAENSDDVFTIQTPPELTHRTPNLPEILDIKNNLIKTKKIIDKIKDERERLALHYFLIQGLDTKSIAKNINAHEKTVRDFIDKYFDYYHEADIDGLY